jgi:hypothetical protein
MKKNLSLILFLAIAFCACSKKTDDSILVTGNVHDTQTNVMLPGSKVFLQQSGCSSAPITIATYITDAHGAFSFKYKPVSGQCYNLDAHADKYFDLPPGLVSLDPGITSTQNLLFGLRPEAYLKVHVTDSSNADHISFNVRSINLIWSDTFSFNNTSGALHKGMVSGDLSNQIEYWVTPHGSSTTQYHTFQVYVPEFDTTSVSINY